MPDGGAALTWWYLFAAAVGYLLGSIPFGLVLTRAAGLGDIRRLGSGNIGATNVLRTGSKALAAATVLLDGGKGAVAVLALAPWDAGLVAGFAAVIGHNFPVWLRFRGGKGVATTLGVLLAVAWPVGLLACLTWLVVAAVFRYSSLAALVAIMATPFTMQWLADGPRIGLAAALTVLAIVRHQANIRRLLKGQELKIGAKGMAGGPS
ncbi:MAG: glycerol-3-phosphate 1-O-acyltransferase PlsY [Proteobacteria bacterium]|nr:glycerol-3-phosphate 1-O-acyltransferase PlsY [Pseudomonadota bacterium]